VLADIKNTNFMKGILKHIIYLLLLSFAVEIYAQTPIGILNSTTEELYSVFDKKESPGCAIAIIKNGEKVYQNCFGLSNIESKTPITDSTEFFLASVSKQFTGYAVSKLILDGKLDYNSHLSFYLPNQNSLWDSVKIKHLIHQASGIWDWPYLFLATGHTFDDVINSDGILKLIKSQSQLSFPTQSKFQYTSSNYMLLGEVVKSIVKEDYYEWMQKNVLYSANMMNTRFQRSNTEMIANRASGYLFKNGNYYRTTNNFSPIGTGFIYSTIEDMSNWMNYLLKEKDLPIVSQMFETSMLVNDKEIPYAFGLMKREKNTFWHDGFLQGFRVITILNPKENFADKKQNKTTSICI
jgi:CubicO group peptidase (beta-lactamase class C family)